MSGTDLIIQNIRDDILSQIDSCTLLNDLIDVLRRLRPRRKEQLALVSLFKKEFRRYMEEVFSDPCRQKSFLLHRYGLTIIPHDVTRHIFQMIGTVQDLNRIAHVCKQFYKMITGPQHKCITQPSVTFELQPRRGTNQFGKMERRWSSASNLYMEVALNATNGSEHLEKLFTYFQPKHALIQIPRKVKIHKRKQAPEFIRTCSTVSLEIQAESTVDVSAITFQGEFSAPTLVIEPRLLSFATSVNFPNLSSIALTSSNGFPPNCNTNFHLERITSLIDVNAAPENGLKLARRFPNLSCLVFRKFAGDCLSDFSFSPSVQSVFFAKGIPLPWVKHFGRMSVRSFGVLIWNIVDHWDAQLDLFVSLLKRELADVKRVVIKFENVWQSSLRQQLLHNLVTHRASVLKHSDHLKRLEKIVIWDRSRASKKYRQVLLELGGVFDGVVSWEVDVGKGTVDDCPPMDLFSCAGAGFAMWK